LDRIAEFLDLFRGNTLSAQASLGFFVVIDE